MIGTGLTVVLPMLNEADNAEWVIEELFSTFEPTDHELFVVAVNDGSSDATLRVLDGLAERFARLQVCSHDRRRGYGCALRTGLAMAETRIAGWMDGDGQYDPLDLLVFVDSVQQGAVAAIGVRTARADAAHRKFLGKVGTRVASQISRVDLRDADAGIKLFDTESVDLVGLSATGGYISTEALRRVRNVGRIDQFDVRHRERQAGKQTGASIRVLAELVIDFCRCQLAESKSKTSRERQ